MIEPSDALVLVIALLPMIGVPVTGGVLLYRDGKNFGWEGYVTSRTPDTWDNVIFLRGYKRGRYLRLRDKAQQRLDMARRAELLELLLRK